MAFVEGLLAMLHAIESDAIVIHEERCISVRNRNASCLRCVETCASGALAHLEGQLRVDPELCIGCGTCATACPTCAIELGNPSDDDLTSLIKRSIVATGGHPVIACEPALVLAGSRRDAAVEKEWGTYSKRVSDGFAYDEAMVVSLPCLGRVDESALVGMAAYKASDVTLVCGDCGMCRYAAGGDMIRQVVDSACGMLGAFGSDLAVGLTSVLPDRVRGAGHGTTPESKGMSRRDFLQVAKDGSARVVEAATKSERLVPWGDADVPAHAVPCKVDKSGSLSHFVPDRRLRLYNYLKHIGDPVASQVETRVIGAISIDGEKCNSCRMCAVFCPTGAIVKLDDDAMFGIVHRPSACVQCRLCESICPEQAIAVSGLVPIGQFMGKEAICCMMERPTWTPNRPTSMYDKLHSVLGEDLEMCMF